LLIPDSAHGTNPATSAMAGMRVVQLKSDKRGNLDLEALKKECDESLAGLMLTNPNTLGLFEENVLEVTKMVHEAGRISVRRWSEYERPAGHYTPRRSRH
jgi:glycine dehydrogenase subunit 2